MLAQTGGKIGKVVEYTSYPEAYQDLALKRTDFVINTIINLQALVKEKPAVFEVGLPMALRIVDLHHGTLEISSAQGRGAMVRIMMPLIQASTTTEPNSSIFSSRPPDRTTMPSPLRSM